MDNNIYFVQVMLAQFLNFKRVQISLIEENTLLQILENVETFSIIFSHLVTDISDIVMKQVYHVARLKYKDFSQGYFAV